MGRPGLSLFGLNLCKEEFMEMKAGFIGLGMMGKPMAANLLNQGYSLSVWNRTPEKARDLVDQGARLVSSPAEAATLGPHCWSSRTTMARGPG